MLRASIPAKPLKDRLAVLSRLTPRRPQNKTLETIQLEVDYKLNATLRATDGSTYLAMTVPLDRGANPGKIQLPGHGLSALACEAKGGSVRFEELDQDCFLLSAESVPTQARAIAIYTKKTTTTMMVPAPSSFPWLAAVEPPAWFELAPWKLEKLLKQALPAAGDNTRFALDGCAVEFDGQVASVVATDGMRLVHAHSPASGPRPLMVLNVSHNGTGLAPTVPAGPLKFLTAAIAILENPNRSLRLGWTWEGHLQAVGPELFWAAHRPPGRFPGWRDLATLPGFSDAEVRDSRAFIDALERLLESTRLSVPVKLRLNRGRVELENPAGTTIALMDSVVAPRAESAARTFQSKHLWDIAKAVPRFTITFSDTDGPTAFRSEGLDCYVQPVKEPDPPRHDEPSETNGVYDDETPELDDSATFDPAELEEV